MPPPGGTGASSVWSRFETGSGASAAGYKEPGTRTLRRPRMALRKLPGIRTDSRWRADTGLCQRLGSRSAPHRAQPAAYGVTRSPHSGQ
jgi:hypothetical protein